MAMLRCRELLLAHLFASPLAREAAGDGEEHEPTGIVPMKQQDYARERDVITRALADANRDIAFLSQVAGSQNFLMNLTGCRVLHFNWNGLENQEKVFFENTKGLAAPVTEEWLQRTCRQQDRLPELVVLTAASAKLVAKIFISAGISNVVAVDTSGDGASALSFLHSFYRSLAQGFTLRESFEAGVKRLPDGEEDRCALLPDGEHSISPFDDAKGGTFTNRTPRSPSKMPERRRPSSLHGREIQVQEVYTHMVQHSKVITITGRPGIGKTEVALRACEYARERCQFVETFFVSLQDKATGAPITALKEVIARIANAFGISKKEVLDHTEGLLGCIQHKFALQKGDLLVVLDGCSPYFVDEGDKRVKLSSVVEQLCQRVSKLQYIVTIVTQVGIAKEKVVHIDKLSGIAAAELFVASAPREVTVEELRGGMVVSGPQVQLAECMRLFAGGIIMTALGRHPGAIIAASSMLRQWHLLTNEDQYLQDIAVRLQRYDQLEEEFVRRLGECQQEQSDSLERWLARARPMSPPPATPANESTGDFWWRQALERYTDQVGALSQPLPWEALCKHSLAPFFVQVLGDEGRDRPLRSDDFQALGNNRALWDPYRPPGSTQGGFATQQGFVGAFWPWFKAATLLLKWTRCWGFQSFPVICGLTTFRFDGMRLLNGRPQGTFLIRLSSKPGALSVMYVKPKQEVGNVLIKASTDAAHHGKFEIDYGRHRMIAPLKHLIEVIPEWTHLFPDTPKREAFAGVQ